MRHRELSLRLSSHPRFFEIPSFSQVIVIHGRFLEERGERRRGFVRRDVENGNVAELGVDGWWPWCDVIRTNLVGFRVCHDEETRDWTLMRTVVRSFSNEDGTGWKLVRLSCSVRRLVPNGRVRLRVSVSRYCTFIENIYCFIGCKGECDASFDLRIRIFMLNIIIFA